MKKLAILALFILPLFANNNIIEVYESPTCGCCDKWAEYMKAKGYTLNIHKSNDFIKNKEQYNIKPEYQSCHTGIIAGYAIEGHVPESAISWLLQTKPKDVIGIAAPGMPQGSPGMEQGYEEEYPVIIMLKDGGYKIYGYFKGDRLVRK